MSQEAFGLSGDREDMGFPVIKSPASKRNEFGTDLYTLSEVESPKSDLTDEECGSA